MPCFSPLQAYRSKNVNASGKRGLVFNPNAGYKDLPVEIACGQCTGCRLQKSKQWAIRCLHEASLYTDNCFITLTYDDINIPNGGTLKKKDYQDFMKRLRFKYRPKIIRFYQCGEYGEQTARPHYHACLFNHDFSDKILYSDKQGVKLYISPTLNKLWPQGFSTIGAVTLESAAYVARYIMKKVTGVPAEEHYKSLDPRTGELSEIIPEYTTMSRRPGIAAAWYERYKTDVYPDDFITVNGMKLKPPQYYDSKFEIENPEGHENVKNRRKENAKKHKQDYTPERLRVRQEVAEAKLNQSKRTI